MAQVIDVTVNDATQPYIVSWNTGETVEDIANLSAGTYTITVTDANQCVKEADIVVGNNTGNLNVSSYQVSNENCGNGDGSINISVSGGTLPYSYNWSNGSTTEDISNLSAGSYTVTITDGNGCSLIKNYTVINNTGNLSASAIVINEVCGNGNGFINLSVSGNAGTLTYLWNNGATTQDITGLSAGLHSCVITDANGCVLSTPTYNLINESSTLLLANTQVINEDCNNSLGEINLTITGGTTPISYNWSTGASTEDITGLSAGTYSCIITDDNGCEVQTGIINLFNTPGNLELETDYITDEICNNNQGAIYVTTTGGTTPIAYSWNNGSNSEDLINISAGSYSLTATDANGCVYIHNETVDNTSGTLQINNAVVINENCNDASGSINIILSGGNSPFNYSWSNGAATEDILGLSAGNYSILVEDNNGCTVSNSYTIINNSGDLAVTYLGTAENCSNGSGTIDITVSGGTSPYTYLWSSGATTEDITNLNGGNYSCTITDDLGCSITTGNIFISNNPGNLSVNSSFTNENCSNADGSITLSVTGGQTPYNFTWSPNVSSTTSAVNLSAGTYLYTVADINGCQITDSVIINNSPGTLAVSNASITNELCDNDAGAIDITVTGGAMPIDYLWNTGATTEDLASLNQGTYSCTITDGNGCTINTGNYTVSNASGTLTVDDVQVIDESCGNNLGAINITIIGGQTPYTYLWNTGATTEDLLTGLSSGNYNCTITDNNGCEVQVNATVQNTSGSLYTSGDVLNNETCNGSNGAININPQGGTGGYSFVWSNGAVTEDISGLSAGNYSVTISDGGGCSIVKHYTVVNNGSNFNITNTSITNEICGNNAGAINISVQGGDAPFSYAWSNGSWSQDLYNISSGNYSVTITDVNSCTTNGTFVVGENTGTLSIASVAITDENCGDNAGAVDVTLNAVSTVVCCSYTLDLQDAFGDGWDGASLDVNINGSLYGNFTVPSGTSSAYSIPVCDGDLISLTYNDGFFENEHSYTLNDASGSTVFAATGPPTVGTVYTGSASCPSSAPVITYNWSNGSTTEDLTNVNAGNYSVVISDSYGCSVDTAVTIQNITGAFAVTLNSVTDEMCGDSTGVVDINVSGGGLPYNFSWSNGATTEDISGLTAGTYQVMVTDDNGCSSTLSAIVNNISGTLSISNALTNDENCGDATGYIDITVSGGNTPYSYQWSNGATTQDLYSLSTGNYTVVITDGSGCQITEDYFIDNIAGSGMSTTSVVEDEICGNGEGSIQVTVSGGVAPFVYSWIGGNPSSENCCNFTLDMHDTGNSWNGASITVNINSAFEGSYTVSGSGANMETFEVCDGDTVDLIWNAGSFDNEVFFSLLDGSGATLFNHPSGTGPTPGTIYSTVANCPTPANNTTGLINLSEGTYELTVIDDIGCSVVQTYVVNNDPSNLNVNITTIQDEQCGQGNGQIFYQTTGGASPYVGTLNGVLDLIPVGQYSNLLAGTYQLIVSDENGCVDTTNNIVIDDVVPFTTGSSVNNASCGFCNDGSIDLTVTGDAPYTYAWSNGATTQDISNLLPDTYCVIITGASGCQDSLCFNVDYPVAINELDNNWNVNIYPNPTPNNFTLEYNFSSNHHVTFYLMNMLGEIVHQQQIIGNHGTLFIGDKELEPGIYVVKLVGDDKEQTIKLVVSR